MGKFSRGDVLLFPSASVVRRCMVNLYLPSHSYYVSAALSGDRKTFDKTSNPLLSIEFGEPETFSAFT
jgi:hypothetical protein